MSLKLRRIGRGPEFKFEDVIYNEVIMLRKLVTNLLIDNPNLKYQNDKPWWNAKLPYYFEAYPHTADFVRGPMRRQASYIVERIDTLIDMMDDK